MKSKLLLFIAAIIYSSVMAGKDTVQKLGDSIVVGATGVSTMTNLPDTTGNPVTDNLIKVIVGVVVAFVSHLLINLFKAKGQKC